MIDVFISISDLVIGFFSGDEYKKIFKCIKSRL